MERPASDRAQLGTDTVATPPETLTEIRSATAGVFVKFGTLVAAMAGAEPAVPPRGVVRTTCEGGSGVPFFRLAYTASSARCSYSTSGTNRVS